jgi:two-component system response regulator LytT
MTGLRALIVDDEPHVRSELSYALRNVSGGVEIAEATSAIDALARLQSETYDVVFLDIRMPGLSGMEAMPVINSLPRRPDVVFVTAHDDHAVDAFDHDAADYLLKPVSEKRLSKTLERLRKRHGGAPAAVAESAPVRMPVERDGRTLLVRPTDIRYVCASGHDVSVHVFEGDYRYRGTLAECAARLEPRGFLRVHRSYLVNPDHVVEVRPFFAGTYVLLADDKARTEIPVSRAFAKTVRSAFGL